MSVVLQTLFVCMCVCVMSFILTKCCIHWSLWMNKIIADVYDAAAPLRACFACLFFYFSHQINFSDCLFCCCCCCIPLNVLLEMAHCHQAGSQPSDSYAFWMYFILSATNDISQFCIRRILCQRTQFVIYFFCSFFLSSICILFSCYCEN